MSTDELRLKRLGSEIAALLGDRSQGWLAEQARVSQPTISRIVRGQQRPDAGILARIARALGTDPAVLLRLAGVALPAGARDGRVEFLASELDRLLPQLSAPMQELMLDQLADYVDLLRLVVQEQQGHLPAPAL